MVIDGSSEKTATKIPAVRSSKPLVLVVGFADSVHTARWVNMALGFGFRFVIFPVYHSFTSPEFVNPKTISSREDLEGCSDRQAGIFDMESIGAEELDELKEALPYNAWQPHWLRNAVMTHPGQLVLAIRRLRPDVVHSMVVQFGGYLVLAAKRYLGSEFPTWLLSNWGSDIYLFRMLSEHRERLAEIAVSIDGYHAECHRDVGIIRQMGFRGFIFPALPATGGTNFRALPRIEQLRPPSERREVLLKGYHGWSGRALHILCAVHLAAESLRGYTIRITLACPEVKSMAAEIVKEDGLDIVIEPYLPDHAEAMKRLGNARLVVGLGISDGISTTLLEAMAMGVFPIQGDRSCGDEWIVPNETGMLVSPHDTEALAQAIRRAMTDDDLVDMAALKNRSVVEQRWNAQINGKVAAEQYGLLMASVNGAKGR
jgi:hypothetical protein